MRRCLVTGRVTAFWTHPSMMGQDEQIDFEVDPLDGQIWDDTTIEDRVLREVASRGGDAVSGLPCDMEYIATEIEIVSMEYELKQYDLTEHVAAKLRKMWAPPVLVPDDEPLPATEAARRAAEIIFNESRRRPVDQWGEPLSCLALIIDAKTKLPEILDRLQAVLARLDLEADGRRSAAEAIFPNATMRDGLRRLVEHLMDKPFNKIILAPEHLTV